MDLPYAGPLMLQVSMLVHVPVHRSTACFAMLFDFPGGHN